MRLDTFIKRLPDKESFKQRFKVIKDEVGFVCMIYGHKKHFLFKQTEIYGCKACQHHNTFKSITKPYHYQRIDFKRFRDIQSSVLIPKQIRGHFVIQDLEEILNTS